jgi:hypothetical protein
MPDSRFFVVATLLALTVAGCGQTAAPLGMIPFPTFPLSGPSVQVRATVFRPSGPGPFPGIVARVHELFHQGWTAVDISRLRHSSCGELREDLDDRHRGGP